MKFGKKKKIESEVGDKGLTEKKSKKKKTIVLQSPSVYVFLASCLATIIAAVAVFAYQSLVILPLQNQLKNEVESVQLSALNLVFSEKLISLQSQVAYYAEGIPEQIYTGSAASRTLQAELALKAMPNSLRALVAPAGKASRDNKPPLSISFASLDLIRSVEQSRQTKLEAFAVSDKWYVQVAAPRIGGNNQVTGTFLVMFDAAVLQPDWSGLPEGNVQLLQTVGSKQQPVIIRGTAADLALKARTGLSQWSVAYSPNAGFQSQADPLLLSIAMLAGGLLAGMFVAAVFMWFLKKARADIGYTTAYVEAVIKGEPTLQPKIQLSLMYRMVMSISKLVQSANLSKPGRTTFATGAPQKVRQEAASAEAGSKDADRADAGRPLSEASEDGEDSELEDAEPLFQGDSLDIEMLGDDDLLDLNDEDLGLDEAAEASNASGDGNIVIAEKIFRAYDIRGVYGDTLTVAIMGKIGKALGSEAIERGALSICVGMDGRESSPDLAQSLIQSLVSTGLKVVNIGVVPTPVLYFAIEYLQLDAGAMVAGSHYPPDYNGLKMVIKGEALIQQDLLKLLARIRASNFTARRGELTATNVRDDYIETIISDIAVATPLKVVVDAGNGVAGELAPDLFTELGCEVIPLHCEIDSQFPHHLPDPSKEENLQELIAKVKENEADIGIALDGDGDRVGVVTNEGRIVWPDRLLMLFAKDVVSRNPGADVVFDVKCSRRLSGLISGFGGRPVMWRSGHSLMKAKMKETGALLAGEMSGHIFFKERWYGFDDGLYSAARLLEILGIEDRSAQAVFDEFPEDFSTPELQAAVADEVKFQIMARLEKQGQWGDATISAIDGLRIEYSDGWGLCRASNTTPALALRFEAETEAGLQRIQGIFREQLLAVEPEMNLPF